MSESAVVVQIQDPIAKIQLDRYRRMQLQEPQDRGRYMLTAEEIRRREFQVAPRRCRLARCRRDGLFIFGDHCARILGKTDALLRQQAAARRPFEQTYS